MYDPSDTAHAIKNVSIQCVASSYGTWLFLRITKSQINTGLRLAYSKMLQAQQLIRTVYWMRV